MIYPPCIRLTLVALAFVACGARAEDVGDKTLSAEEYVQILQPLPAGMGSKGVGTGGPSATQKIPSLSLRLQFDLGSARIRPAETRKLDNLAKALNDERLRSFSFKIVGHTDITGSHEFNMRLSQERAQSVVAFLTGQGVDQHRIPAEGKGPDQLLPDRPPESPDHRRVEVTLLPAK